MNNHASTTRCVVCGKDAYISGWYYVKNSVWKEAGFKPHQLAHCTCLAYRLGRRLTKDDFTDSPINDVVIAIFGKGKLRPLGDMYDDMEVDD